MDYKEIFAQEIKNEATHIITDDAGMTWYPYVAWTPYDMEPGTGFPTFLYATYRLTLAESDWDYQAMGCNFVSGLHDHDEHTFDSGRGYDTDYVCLLATEWIVAEVVKALDISEDIADQFLIYRTLYTRLPEECLRYYGLSCLRHNLHETAHDQPGRERLRREYWSDQPGLLENWPLADVTDAHYLELFDRTWQPRCQLAPQFIAQECSGRFTPPVSVFALFEVDAACTVCLTQPSMSFDDPATLRFFNFALTHNELAWDAVYEKVDARTLKLKPDGLSRLRSSMDDEDATRRIGSCPADHFSDFSLRLLLQGRLRNIVGPQDLWAALGLMPPLNLEWRLQLPQCARLGYVSEEDLQFSHESTG